MNDQIRPKVSASVRLQPEIANAACWCRLRLATTYAQAGGQGAYTGELYSLPHRFDVPMQEPSFKWLPRHFSVRATGAARGPFVSAIVAYCFVALCLARSSSARRFSRMMSGIEDNIETRCSFVHGRSPASAKAGDQIEPRRAIIREQAPTRSV
jgi:hypothetical protein